jgi:hypothetical protein
MPLPLFLEVAQQQQQVGGIVSAGIFTLRQRVCVYRFR